MNGKKTKMTPTRIAISLSDMFAWKEEGCTIKAVFGRSVDVPFGGLRRAEGVGGVVACSCKMRFIQSLLPLSCF